MSLYVENWDNNLSKTTANFIPYFFACSLLTKCLSIFNGMILDLQLKTTTFAAQFLGTNTFYRIEEIPITTITNTKNGT